MMTTRTVRKVIGYVRVSTDKQEIGPEVQTAALEAEAARQGWEIKILREDFASAKSLTGRPVLASALRELKAGRADALVVSKLDRLSRSVADFSALLEISNRQQWALICLDLGIDTGTITGAAMAQVTVTFAEMERKKIGERTRDGMAKIKATTGKHMGRRSVLPEETIALIRSLREAGASLASIAKTLSTEGVPTAMGCSWHASTIRQILNRNLEVFPTEGIDNGQKNLATPSKTQILFDR